jgi:hypothetical protein
LELEESDDERYKLELDERTPASKPTGAGVGDRKPAAKRSRVNKKKPATKQS